MAPRSRDVTLYVSPFDDSRRARSHTLLRLAASRFTGESRDRTVMTGEKGKPFFPGEPQLHFSISHSGAFWMCAFSGQPLGLDLQIAQPCDRAKLSSRFFHPLEDAYLAQRGYNPFFHIWAAKESYLKLTGQGITDGLDNFSVVSPQGSFPELESVVFQQLPWEAGYSLFLCTPAPCHVTIVHL